MVPTPFSQDDIMSSSPMDDAVIVVTPYSTGCCIALEVQKRGYKIICLWSKGFSQEMKMHVPKSCDSLSYEIELDEQETLQDTAQHVLHEARTHSLRIVSCICGGEAGVDLTDALSEELGLLSNGTSIPNRRDKKVQQELIKAKGMRSVRQAAGTTLAQVQEFLETERYPLIVKPLDSAGSDGVELCHSYKEAKAHVLNLLGDYELVNGGHCQEVLCQEYLKGKEYVVDHVSRDGVHKTAMVWVYDKRAANGATFVYYGDIPVDTESPEAKVLIPYVRGVLDAMGIRHGPSHGEVIITEDGTPCLVEMNCRAFGGDGIWQPLCRALTGGYNQIDAAVHAYLDKDAFDALPDKPPSPYLASGQCVDLVSYTSGTVKSTPGYDIIKLLPSFVCLESHITAGSKIVPTVDLATAAAQLVVMHPDKQVLERDIALIRQMESRNVVFELEQQDKSSLSKKPQEKRHRSCSLDVQNDTTWLPLVRHKTMSLCRVSPDAANQSSIYKY